MSQLYCRSEYSLSLSLSPVSILLGVLTIVPCDALCMKSDSSISRMLIVNTCQSYSCFLCLQRCPLCKVWGGTKVGYWEGQCKDGCKLWSKIIGRAEGEAR